MAVAELMGNITPSNVDFVVERLKPLLDPSIYNDTVRGALEQAQSLKEDRISQSFMPRTVEYEASTNKFSLKGIHIQRVLPTTSTEMKKRASEKEMTFEFVLT